MPDTASALYSVTLHLARGPEFPNGSARHGYTIVMPLDADGHLDAKLWERRRADCTAQRFWGDDDDAGMLVHRSGGQGGATWLIDYEAGETEDDEPAFRLDGHRIAIGEYVSIRDEAGALHTFKVVDLGPL
ncbi:hypothetical protein [Segnochrobactrum spirostomi]|uniref:Uncharacterized protein n=1 Tax=Segnochrobactrum spirostomi TaxID=2608987 RepID=A0A6A7Y363_9HYPH|nr:hypothetical protein [Segnochrobactrum spirostomi]MQT13503.1 hypothetical protein [Segnochrobactrum spirostomi]